jgi:hypothetical protein
VRLGWFRGRDSGPCHVSAQSLVFLLPAWSLGPGGLSRLGLEYEDFGVGLFPEPGSMTRQTQ